MFNLDTNQCIRVTRGDSFSVPLFINRGTEMVPLRYVLSESDVVYFHIMHPNQAFECAVIQKEFTAADLNENGDILVEIEPTDTIKLPVGNYYYQAKIRMIGEDGKVEVNTLMHKHKLCIED